MIRYMGGNTGCEGSRSTGSWSVHRKGDWVVGVDEGVKKGERDEGGW